MDNTPNSTPILVMGILGISLSFVYGIGLIFSIIGLAKAGAYAKLAPIAGKAKAGKILSVFGLVLSIIAIIFWIFIFGFMASFSF